jgi:methylated-DNA-[protein]-cysteine S-methyltransferase
MRRMPPGRRKKGETTGGPLHTTFDTKAGTCAIAYGAAGVLAIMLPSHSAASTERAVIRAARQRTGTPSTLDPSPPPQIVELADLIRRHLDGVASDFSAVVLDEQGLSDFRREVYAATRRIPAGEVKTYGEVARDAGSPAAARAVGRALATNPFPVVVPCHRVLGSEHDLHGFSAPGGLRTKASLLELEGVDLESRQPQARTGARAAPATPRASRSRSDEQQPLLPFDAPAQNTGNR